MALLQRETYSSAPTARARTCAANCCRTLNESTPASSLSPARYRSTWLSETRRLPAIFSGPTLVLRLERHGFRHRACVADEIGDGAPARLPLNPGITPSSLRIS